jgi:predicted dehydrogenase
MSTAKARIAVVGTGWWSTSAHIPALKDNPNAQLVALSDLRPDLLQRAAEAYSVSTTYTDFREMLANEQLDGVVVCVNHSAHYEVAKGCLEAGFHVMLDKPMVLETPHAYDLRDLARARNRELIIGYPWHYTDTSKHARDIVQSGELGAVQYVSSLFASMVIEFLRGNDQAYSPVFGYKVTGPGSVYADPQKSGGGQGHLQVTHSAGSLFFVTGLQADRVTSFMENFDAAVDVADAIAVRFQPVNGSESAAIGVLGSTGNVGQGDGHHELQVYCENGRLVLNHTHGTLFVRYHDGREHTYTLPEGAPTYPSSATSQNLVDVILGRAPNGSPAEVGVRAVELLDAAYRSTAKNGAPVSIADLSAP